MSANEYVFWDSAHPSGKMHQLIAGDLIEFLNQAGLAGVKYRRASALRRLPSSVKESRNAIALVHQVSDWGSGAAANFGWMREAKRENTRCGL